MPKPSEIIIFLSMFIGKMFRAGMMHGKKKPFATLVKNDGLRSLKVSSSVGLTP